MPAVSERQRRFMGTELSRHRRGKKTRTGMSESKLEDFASKSMGDVMEKNVVKAISKYLGKTGEGGEGFKTALDAFSTKPKTPKEAAAAVEDRRKYDEAAAKITPPKRVIAKENDYPPTKGERRSAKRQKAKKMKVTGSGAKNLQRIIGQKAEAAGGMDKAKPSPKRDALRDMGLTQRTNIPKPREMDFPSDPKPTQVSIGGRKLQLKTTEKSVIKSINRFLRKQTSEVTTADPEAAKRAAARKRQEADIGKPMPSPFVHTTPDPLTGKKPPKKPKASWAAIERPEGAQRTTAGQSGGGMVAFGKKKKSATPTDKQLIKAIAAFIKGDGKYTHEEAKAAFDRDAAKVMSGRQRKRDAELSRERGLPEKIAKYTQKEDTSRYNKKAVDAAIKRDKSIGKKESKAIHGLLRGRQKSDS